MKKFYFTFGLGHENNERYQVIWAKSESEAHAKMRELYGNKFAFCYNHEQWSMARLEGFFKNLVPFANQYQF